MYKASINLRTSIMLNINVMKKMNENYLDAEKEVSKVLGRGKRDKGKVDGECKLLCFLNFKCKFPIISIYTSYSKNKISFQI